MPSSFSKASGRSDFAPHAEFAVESFDGRIVPGFLVLQSVSLKHELCRVRLHSDEICKTSAQTGAYMRLWSVLQNSEVSLKLGYLHDLITQQCFHFIALDPTLVSLPQKLALCSVC